MSETEEIATIGWDESGYGSTDPIAMAEIRRRMQTQSWEPPLATACSSSPLYLGHDPDTCESLRRRTLGYLAALEEAVQAVSRDRYSEATADQCLEILLRSRGDRTPDSPSAIALMTAYDGMDVKKLRETLTGCLEHDAALEFISHKADVCASKLFGEGTAYLAQVTALHEHGAWISSLKKPLMFGFALGMNDRDEAAECIAGTADMRWIYLPEGGASASATDPLNTVCLRAMQVLGSDDLTGRCPNPFSVLTNHPRAEEQCLGCTQPGRDHREHFTSWDNQLKASRDRVLRGIDKASRADEEDGALTITKQRNDVWTQYRTRRIMLWDALQETPQPRTERLRRLTRVSLRAVHNGDEASTLKPCSFCDQSDPMELGVGETAL